MAQKSILFVITKSVWGGVAKYVFDLATHLSVKEFKVFVAAGGREKFAQKIIEQKIPYFDITYFQRTINPFKDIFAFFEVLRLIWQIKPDIIHANSPKAGGAAGLAGWIYKIANSRPLRMIFTAHGWAFNESRPKWQTKLIKIFSRLICYFYNKVICVSRHDYQTGLKNKIASAQKLIIIHNGIDIKTLSFLSREQAQKKLLDRTSPLVIGTIAEWTKNKGLIYLLEAIQILETRFPKFDVVLIGSGENPDKEKMFDLVQCQKLTNIHLIEFVESVANYLKAFDIFVLPSVKEGLPYTILEAMAAEVPVIASKTGGIPEIITDRINGLLIKPKNSHELAEKIVYLIDRPETRKMLGKNSRQKIIKEFDFNQTLRKTKEIY